MLWLKATGTEMELQAQAAAVELTDVATLREVPRQKVEGGTLASARGADRHTVLRLLNEALATELVCTLRCRRHYFIAFGELTHADRIAARIAPRSAHAATHGGDPRERAGARRGPRESPAGRKLGRGPQCSLLTLQLGRARRSVWRAGARERDRSIACGHTITVSSVSP